MRFPEGWLREWVDPDVDTEDLCARLTLLGLEVEGYETTAPAFDGVVVGEIVDVEAHPEADRLRVCRVSDGDRQYDVVCGAPNAAVGLRVPFARVGAQLPGGVRIQAAELRGVQSGGMLCSGRELGLETDDEGLMELASDAPVGADFRAWARLDEAVIELELTPNRGDCLCIRGLARETGVAWSLPVAEPVIEPVPARIDEAMAVWLEDASACPRYTGRVIRGVDAGAASPAWLVRRLEQCGIRPLSMVVDVTNYVMLELGQPMHAFDLRKLRESIVVRWARAGESLELLDGRTIGLDADSLVIADERGPVALAGIMGGAPTAVDEGTRDIFLESACFLPAAVAGRARRHGCHTDSSHRFERGVDPELQQRAIERATALIQAIGGGEAGPTHDTVEADALPRRAPIELRQSRIERLLGFSPATHEVADILRRLGLQVERTDGGWTVIPASWRYDLSLEADLIEEVARVHGYNRSPRTHGAREPRIAPTAEATRPADTLRDELAARDYREVITYSFVDAGLQQRLEPDLDALALQNPISSDMGVMRTTLWAGLLQCLQHNINRQQERVRIFEIGRVFRPQDGDTLEHDTLAGLVAGPAWPEQWGSAAREVDFHDAKADVEVMLAGASAVSFTFEAESHPALHPGRTARILADGSPAGWLGSLHPKLQKDLELERAPILFQLPLAVLQRAALPTFQPVSRYPAIRRDLAVVVDEDVPGDALVEGIRQAAGEDLQDVFIFDVYRGKGVNSGRKSVALGLILQGLSRTLRDAEVESTVQAALDHLYNQHGATLRE